MSSTFQETATALANDAELRERILSVTSAEERAAILREAGVPVPSREDVDAHRDSALAGISGGGTTTNVAAASMDAGAAAAG